MAILYQRYSSLLYAFAYRIVADHQVAEDLLQESFLAVWQRASSYSPNWEQSTPGLQRSLITGSLITYAADAVM